MFYARPLTHAVLLCAVLTPSVGAQDLPWRHVYDGEGRGDDRPALIYDHSDPTGHSWYTLITGAAWHTTDLGVTMNPISEVGMDNQIWSGLAIAYDQPDILYAATGTRGYDLRETYRFPGNGVYRSSDKGGSWTRLPFFPGVEDMDDLHFLTNIITSSAGDTVIVATNKRILRSADSGQTWEVVHVLASTPDPLAGAGTLEPRLTVLHQHPASLATIFATVRGHDGGQHGTTVDHYALVSRDGGSTWGRAVVDGWEIALDAARPEGSRASWLFAHDPTSPSRFWLYAKHPFNPTPTQRYGAKIYRTTDGGSTWADIPTLLKQGRDTTDFALYTPAPNDLHVHPQGGDTITLGLTVGHYRADGSMLLDGTPTGNNPLLIPAPDTYLGFRWVRLEQINLPPGKQFAIMWEEEEYRATYLFSGEFPNTYPPETCKSRPRDPTDPNEWVYLVLGGLHEIPAEKLAGSAGRRDATVAASAGYASRHAPDPPGPKYDRGYNPFHCHPDRYDLLRGGTASWGSTTNRNLRRFTPDHFTHYLETAGPPVWRVLALSPSIQNPEQVWAATRDAQPEVTGVWRTDDYTDTWEMVHVDPDIETVHVHQADDQVIYTNHSVSRDAGQTWEPRAVDERSTIQSWDRMRSHPTDPATVYVCYANDGLRKWTGYLQSDSLIASSEEYGFCRDLLVFPDQPERLWMGADKGLFESLDGGDTWSRQNRGLPNVPITRVYLAPDRSEILVGTIAYGLFVLDATEVGIMPPSRVSTEDLPEKSAEKPALLPNYPNPFSGETMLQFTTEKPGHVRLDLFDLLGRKIETVADQLYTRGAHRVRWNGGALSRGVYLVRMEVDGRQVGVQKVVRR